MTQDLNFTTSVAFPAASATAHMPALDLGTVIPGPVGSALRMRIDVPALPSLADAHAATFTVEDSADNVTFATLPTTGNTAVTGANGAGSPATQFDFYLPPNVRRYLRVSVAVANGGGDNTAQTAAFYGMM